VLTGLQPREEEENMIIRLQRQWIEDDPSYINPTGETTCPMCGTPFKEPSEVAWAATDGWEEFGVICESCVAYLGDRNPEKYPTRLEYEALLKKYPHAMYPTAGALERDAAEAGLEDPAYLVEGASWVWEPPGERATS
jgi:hypothetical protein